MRVEINMTWKHFLPPVSSDFLGRIKAKNKKIAKKQQTKDNKTASELKKTPFSAHIFPQVTEATTGCGIEKTRLQ